MVNLWRAIKVRVKASKPETVNFFCTSDLQEWYQRCVVEAERDSGWALLQILNQIVNLNKYNPLRARCHFKLSRDILLKRATISVQSDDNACFAWAVVAAMHPDEKHSDGPSSYPHYTLVLNLQGIEFPMSMKQIAKFEQLNNISVNVYSFEEEEREKETKKGPTLFPLHLTNNKRGRHVNFLYIPDHGGNNVGHFVLIKNLPRLLSAQLSKNKAKKFICYRSMH